MPRPPGGGRGASERPRTPGRRVGPAAPWRRHDRDIPSDLRAAPVRHSASSPPGVRSPRTAARGGLPAPYRRLRRHPQPVPQYGTARRSPVDPCPSERCTDTSSQRLVRTDLLKTDTHVSRPVLRPSARGAAKVFRGMRLTTGSSTGAVPESPHHPQPCGQNLWTATVGDPPARPVAEPIPRLRGSGRRAPRITPSDATIRGMARIAPPRRRRGTVARGDTPGRHAVAELPDAKRCR